MSPEDFSLVALLAAGLGLALGLRLLRIGIELVPFDARKRELASRAWPVLSFLAWVGYLLFVAGRVVSADPAEQPWVLSAVLLALAVAAWASIRDLINGVFVKAGRVCQVGDYVEIEGVQGRVEHMGPRVLTLKTGNGEALIPYTKVARAPVLRSTITDTVASHTFQVPAVRPGELGESKRWLREAVMRCHWSSVVREPEVSIVGDGQFEVTAFALDTDQGPEIEASVRARIRELQTAAKDRS